MMKIHVHDCLVHILLGASSVDFVVISITMPRGRRYYHQQIVMTIVGATLFLARRQQGALGWGVLVVPLSRRTSSRLSSRRQETVRLWSSTTAVSSSKMIEEGKLMQDMLQRVRAINQPLPEELRGSALDFTVDGVILGKVRVVL